MDIEIQLSALGWKWAVLGRRLGVHANTLTAWKRDGAPQYAREYLRVMSLLREALG